jgi:hypothetical protein
LREIFCAETESREMLITITDKRREAFSVDRLCKPESLGERATARRPAERLDKFLGAPFHFQWPRVRAHNRSAHHLRKVVKVDLPGVCVAPDSFDAER